MSAILIVIVGVSETFFFAQQPLSAIGEKEIFARRSAKRLPAKGGLLVDAKATIKTCELIIGSGKVVGGTQKTYKRILCADIAFQAQDAHHRVLVEQMSELRLPEAHTRRIGSTGVVSPEHERGVFRDEGAVVFT